MLTNLIDFYEDGLYKDKLKKLDIRKDALMIVNVKQKYDVIGKKSKKFKKLKKNPYLVSSGENLLQMSKYKIMSLNHIYEIRITDAENLIFNLFSYLPRLAKLVIQYSTINIKSSESDFFFQDLQFLDLSFNNIDNEIFNVIKKIKTLKTLNLSGNFIDGNIPDINELENLRELNLSHNKIESTYLKTEETPDELETVNWKKLLKTNISDFFKKLSKLKNLKKLNLSYNKIHFFDIDSDDVQVNHDFANLEILDMSHNVIDDEIAILLIINIKSLKSVDLSGNPIIFNKQAFNNVCYEMNEKQIKVISDLNKEYRNYIIKPYRVPSYIAFHKSVKSKINDMLENRRRMDIDSNTLGEILEGNIHIVREESTFITKKESILPPIDKMYR